MRVASVHLWSMRAQLAACDRWRATHSTPQRAHDGEPTNDATAGRHYCPTHAAGPFTRRGARVNPSPAHRSARSCLVSGCPPVGASVPSGYTTLHLTRPAGSASMCGSPAAAARAAACGKLGTGRSSCRHGFLTTVRHAGKHAQLESHGVLVPPVADLPSHSLGIFP